MCGILGRIHPSLRASRKALDSIRHRGPDASGEWHAEIARQQISLGHTRLSILDLSEAGAQPMHSQSGRWTVVFNGEIYNHPDIRNQLTSTRSFRGSSDTETLIEAIDQMGIEATLPLLNGMFAFAALDHHQKRLFLVRDPFGIKPLYYHQTPSGLCFASEIKALFELGVPKEVNTGQLSTFLQIQYVPSPQTLVENVYRLGPGEILTWDVSNKKAERKQYVEPTRHRYCNRFEHAVEDYEKNLKQAVQRQMLSDVPVGILLSGGIDSALVAAMAAEAGHRPPCFTVGFGADHWECELDDAQQTASELGLAHHKVTLNPESMWDSLPAITASLEEPVGTTSIMAMWELVKLARQHVTVVLTGQGTDEPWGGYRRYQLEVWRHLLPSKVWNTLAALPKSDKLPEFMRRAQHAVPITNIADRFLASNELFSRAEQRELLGRELTADYAIDRFEKWMDWSSQSTLSPVELMMRCDTRMKLADDLLLYGDKMSMAVSLEARVPMLDVELMGFVESLPISYRVRMGKSKIVHKAMAERYLPESIVHRPKKGFHVPFNDWSRGQWKERIHSMFFSEGPHQRWLDQKALLGLWNTHQTGHEHSPRRLFALLMFVSWARWLEDG